MNSTNHTFQLSNIRSPESIIGGLNDYETLNLDRYCNNKSNILILANGFEDRANAFINAICDFKYKADIVLIAKYSTNTVTMKICMMKWKIPLEK